MSQAGGPNSAGSVNIDFTGNVAPLEQAAKKAEAVVQQSAAKMEQVVNQAVPGATAGTGTTPYMPGENYGPMYVAQSEKIVQATQNKVRGFKGLIAPLNEVLGAYSRLIGIGSLIGGMAATVVWAFNYKAETAKKLRQQIDELRASTKAAFEQFTETDAPVNALQKYEQKLEAIDKLEREKIAEAKKLRDGTGPGARASSAGITAAENAAFNARIEAEKQFQKDKNAEESKSMILQQARDEQAANAREDLNAKIAGGYVEAYLTAENEIRRAGETLSGESLAVRIAAIEYERDEKVRIMGEAEKKIADDAIDQAKRVNAEKTRLMREFYAQQREEQAASTRVESFFAGNQGQSFSLANRQRTAIEGQLPSVNYQGAE